MMAAGMKTLNVIGAGRVGRTLASLWVEKRTLSVQDVLDGTAQGARAAVAFIGDGTPAAAFAEMRPADLWMITTPDRHIVDSCQALAAAGLLRASDIVFHCSGATPSSELSAARAAGCAVASVHPLKSFADPRDAVRTFAGTHCAIEGDATAVEVLRPSFERIGGLVAELDPRYKSVYHAASVVVSNYLAALMEVGLRCYEKAGLPRDTATKMMEPIVRETLENVFEIGTTRALTGPIARGDDAVVAKHLKSLAQWDACVTAIYRELGLVALELSRAHGEAEPAALERIHSLLAKDGKGANAE